MVHNMYIALAYSCVPTLTSNIRPNACLVLIGLYVRGQVTVGLSDRRGVAMRAWGLQL